MFRQNYSPMHCYPEKELRLLVQEDEEDTIEVMEEIGQNKGDLQD